MRLLVFVLLAITLMALAQMASAVLHGCQFLNRC